MEKISLPSETENLSLGEIEKQRQITQNICLLRDRLRQIHYIRISGIIAMGSAVGVSFVLDFPHTSDYLIGTFLSLSIIISLLSSEIDGISLSLREKLVQIFAFAKAHPRTTTQLCIDAGLDASLQGEIVTVQEQRTVLLPQEEMKLHLTQPVALRTVATR